MGDRSGHHALEPFSALTVGEFRSSSIERNLSPLEEARMPHPASPDRRRPGARPMVAALPAVTLLTTGIASSSTTAATGPAAPVAPELVAQVENARSGEPVRALLMLPNAEELAGDRTEVLETLRGH